jgi:hypothetical protein
MRYLLLFLFVGCSQSGEIAALKASLRTSEETIVAASSATVTKTDEAIGILRENTTALAAIKSQIEALQVVSKPQELGGDPKASPPNPPAKANTQQAPLKVATPGDSSRIASDGTVLRWNIEGNWNPTILETSRHLGQEHGIDTNGMTHQQMADIHADLHDGRQVAMKSKPVVLVNRGSSCPGGVCPTNTRQRRGLFGWRR